MARKFEKVMPGVVLVGRTAENPGIVYFRKMVNGKREIRKSTLQGTLAIDDRGRATKALKTEFANWRASVMSRKYFEKRMGDTEMKFADLIEYYPKAAAMERVKSGKPSERSVENTVKGMAQFLKAAGLTSEHMCSKLTTDMIDIAITSMIQSGKSKSTAWSYAAAIQGMTARWTGPYYRREGFRVPEFVLPAKRNMRPARYERPTKEQLDKLKAWYENIWNDPDKRKWLAATMMLQFAMRNGDVIRATPGIFAQRTVRLKSGECAERMILHYVPNKTSTSSARSVAWPVSQMLWERITEAQRSIAELAKTEEGKGWWKKNGEGEKDKLSPFAHMTFLRINKELREIFPNAKKASYELRKICVDHVYQNMGLEKASAISGDDPKTVMYYYADPSQAIVEDGLDVTELI